MLEQLIAQVTQKVDGKEAFGFTVKLVLGDAGSIFIDGGTAPISVASGDGAADTTFVMSPEDLAAMLRGELPPMNAYMQGKLRVEGDLGKAMQFGNVFG